MRSKKRHQQAVKIITNQIAKLRIGEKVKADDADLSYGVFRSKLTKIERELGKRFKVSCNDRGELWIKRVK